MEINGGNYQPLNVITHYLTLDMLERLSKTSYYIYFVARVMQVTVLYRDCGRWQFYIEIVDCVYQD